MKQTTKRHPFRQWLGGLLTAGICFGSSALQAQTSLKWQQAPGDPCTAQYFRDVATDGQGNVYAVGAFQGTINFTFPGPLNYPLTSLGGYDIVIAKYNRAGTLLWVERGGGAGNDYGNSIAIHTDINGTVDNVFTTGFYSAAAPTFEGSADFVTVTIPAINYLGGEEIYTSVHSTTGVCKLLRTDGGPGNDRAQGIAVEQRPGNVFSVYAGGIIENGAVFAPNAAIATVLKDGYVIRYGYNNTTPSLIPAAAPTVTFSSAGNDQVANVGVHVTGEIYAVGAYEGNMSLGASSMPVSLVNSGLADAFVVRMNSLASIVQSGNRLSSTGGDYALSLTFDRNSNIYVCGYYAGAATTLNALTLPLPPFGSRDFWVGKLNLSGAGIDFVALTKGGTMNDDRAYDIIADNCGDRIFVAGMVGTGWSTMTYSTSGATVILPLVNNSKLNGMLLQLDRNLANPVAYQTYGTTNLGIPSSSLHEALYGISINNVGDISLAGVTSGSNDPAVGNSNVNFATGAGAVLLTTQTEDCNSATADLNYNCYISSVDMSQWPATATLPAATCMVTGKGIAMRDCIVYEGGDYSNTAGTLGMTIGGATFGACNQDAYLVKYDLYGNPLGGTRVTVSHPVSGNALVSDICTSLSPTPDVYECGAVDSDVTGSLTIAGFLSTLTGLPTSQHLFLASYNDTPGSPFVPNWRVFDQTGMSTASDVCTDPNGDVYLTGVYSTAMTLIHNGAPVPIPAPAFTTMYIMKISPAGTIIWFNGTVAAYPIFPNGISCVSVNTPIVVGESDNGVDHDVFIATFNNGTGALVTNYSPATAPLHQAANEISVSESGTTFAITGTFSGTFAFGALLAITATGSPTNMFAAVYNIPTTWLWSRDEGDMGLGTIGADISFKDQSVIVTGSYQNGAQFNGVAQVSAGSWDVYWSRYNALTGVPINTVNTAGGTSHDNGMAIINLNGALPEADQFGNCAIACGHFFSPTVTFGTITVTNPSGPGAPNLFITKLNSQSSVFSQRIGGPIEEEQEASTIDAPASLNVIATPNPFSESTLIRIDGAMPDNAVIRLYDISGRLAQEPILVSGNAVTIDGSMLENGIYIYTIESGNTSLFTGKLMVQH